MIPLQRLTALESSYPDIGEKLIELMRDATNSINDVYLSYSRGKYTFGGKRIDDSNHCPTRDLLLRGRTNYYCTAYKGETVPVEFVEVDIVKSPHTGLGRVMTEINVGSIMCSLGFDGAKSSLFHGSRTTSSEFILTKTETNPPEDLVAILNMLVKNGTIPPNTQFSVNPLHEQVTLLFFT